MKKRILIINLFSLLFILLVLVITQISFGWVSYVLSFDDNNVSAGDLRYSISGSFISNSSIIYPGENLINEDFEVTNNSPITSQLRLKITYTKVTLVGETPTPATVNYTDAADEHLAVTFGSTFVYDSDSEYWYLNSKDALIAADSGVISLITNLYYNGNYVSIEYSNQSFTVTATVQVKQYDNVSWADLTTYNFSTGLPT